MNNNLLLLNKNNNKLNIQSLPNIKLNMFTKVTRMIILNKSLFKINNQIKSTLLFN